MPDGTANKLHEENRKIPFEHLPVACAFVKCSVVMENTSHPVIACLVLDLALCLEYRSCVAGARVDITMVLIYCVGMSLGSGLLWSKRAQKMIPCPVLKLLRLGKRGVDFTQKERVLG